MFWFACFWRLYFTVSLWLRGALGWGYVIDPPGSLVLVSFVGLGKMRRVVRSVGAGVSTERTYLSGSMSAPNFTRDDGDLGK